MTVRVCIVSQEYPGASRYYGGIGTQYAALAPTWVVGGTEVHVITMQRRDDPQPPRELSGVVIHTIPAGHFVPWHSLRWARQVARKVSELGPFDAVLTPEFRGECETYSNHQSAGPVVTHLLTSSAQLLALRPGLTLLERKGPRIRLALLQERLQAERSRALLAPSHAILNWARELWPVTAAKPTRILPLTIDVAAVRREAAHGRLPAGFPPSERGPVVGLASRLDAHKGAQFLLAAMLEVWRTFPDAQLVFIGRDARFGRCLTSEYLRAQPGGERIHVTGYLAPHEYFAAVAACDVVAIPSLWESFCLAAVEAMALGAPLIATSGHGFDEYVRDGANGRLVPRGEVAPLAAAVESLLGDASARRRLGTAAAATAETFDAPVVAPSYLDALVELTA